MEKELVIIGAGIAGLYAAYYAGLRKIDAVVLESSLEIGGQLQALYPEKPIYDVPGFKKISAKDLVLNLYEQYELYKNEINILLNEQVQSIEQNDQGFLVTTNNQTIQTKTVLIANGGGAFSPKKLEVGKEHYDNVHYSYPESIHLKEKEIIVLGGGDAAVDFALLAHEHAKNVSIIHRRDVFRAHQGNVDELRSKVNVLTPYTVLDVVDDGNNVKKIILEHQKSKEQLTLDVDIMGVFYGMNNSKNNYTTFLIETDNDGIVVKTNMETSIPGIYAAGNCTSYEGKLKTIAVAFGEVATAIGAINDRLNPNQNNHVYSSLLIKE